MYFTLVVHLKSDKPDFKSSRATCCCVYPVGLPDSRTLLPGAEWGVYVVLCCQTADHVCSIPALLCFLFSVDHTYKLIHSGASSIYLGTCHYDYTLTGA